MRPPRIGVLALQGGFAAHVRMCEQLGAAASEVRVPTDLAGLDGLVLPGGESTTMGLGIEREGLAEPLRAFVAAGTPVLGTCAGLIMLDRGHLGLMDIVAERNAFGRQVRSFEADVAFGGFDEPIRGVFIRAPWIAETGPAVETLATVEGHVVAAREGSLLAVAFHPELAGEPRLHAWLLATAAAAAAAAAARQTLVGAEAAGA